MCVHNLPILLYISESVYQVDPDPEIFARALIEAKINTNVTIDCPYGAGALAQFYSVRWLQSHESGFPTSISSSSMPDGYEILSNFSLRINASEVDFPLARDRFQCEVEIDRPNDAVQRLGIGNSVQIKTFSKYYAADI